ncbi:MAG: hypothetical protein QNJ38_16735 [Prochloraceae cyanobacterium]|nr:hypothetical protein [Prochloraceae cyanobacterium]
MRKGRPGGNPDLKKYQFTTEREHPLTELAAFRVDKPTKEALKSGELPGWQEIAREAIAQALEEKRKKQIEQDLQSA